MRTARRLVAAALAFGAAAAGHAQGVDCEALRQQLAAVDRPDPARIARFDRAIEQQRSELARTQAYADSIGCGGLHIFDSAPAQCDPIAARIERMQGNLDALEAQARVLGNGDPERAQDLASRYDGACRSTPDMSGDLTSDPALLPDSPRADEQPQAPQGGDKAICVRTCDGGFFPLATRVRADDLGGLQALCSAQCPGTEARLYTTSDTDNVADAVAVDGSAYAALPNAFRFAKSHDASCACKPADKTWVEALAGAEALLDKNSGDVTVTAKMSADMARPAQPNATPVPARKAAKRDRKTIVLPPPPPVPDAVALGADGVAPGGQPPEPALRLGDGPIMTEPAPDRTRRPARAIGSAPDPVP